MALLKKQEELCLELGDRSGLAHCYGKWGLLARAQRDWKAEQEKLVGRPPTSEVIRQVGEREEFFFARV